MPRGKPATGTRSDKGSRRSEWVDTTCTGCGSPLSRRKSEIRDTVYCSRECYRANPFRDGPGRPANLSVASPRASYGEKRGRVRPDLQPHGQRVLVPGETTKVNGEGYVMRWLGRGVGPYGGWALEHRYVMEQHLGRPLMKIENVHHRDGDRSNNDLANLELWSRQQPPGQRVEDKVAYARMILGLYGTEAEVATYAPERLAKV